MEEWRILDVQRGRGGEFVGRVEHVERVEGVGSDSGGSVAPRRSNEE